jgi:drug/metabolite transporter (DMT)-like permease
MKKQLFQAYLALATVSFFWGTTYLAMRVGVQYANGFAMAGLRQATAGILLAGFFLLRGHRFPDWQTTGKLFVIGLLMFMGSNGLMGVAVKHIPSGLAAIIGATVPIWMSLMGVFFLKEKKLSLMLLVGLLIGLAGIAGIFYDHLGDLFNPAFRYGMMLAFIACISWSFGSIYMIRSHLKVHVLLGAGLQMFFAGLAILLVSTIAGLQPTWYPLPHEFWTALIYLVVVGSIISYSAYAFALKKLPPSLVSVYAYINPLVAVTLGWIVLHEHFDVVTAVSCSVTLAGVYIVNQSVKKSIASSAASFDENLEKP